MHLWIGMLSGLIVVVVCLTGAIWALKIHNWIDTDEVAETEIRETDKPLLKPSQIIAVTQDELSTTPTYITYTKNGPASIGSYSRKSRESILLNPYTGEVLSSNKPGKEEAFDFWLFIRRGHRFLWLPTEVGRPVVNYGTLCFVGVLITGLVFWFPKSRKEIRRKLWFRWGTRTNSWRKIFDLHTVLGLYTSLFLIAISLTGMVWGIEWWSKGVYKITTGGRKLPKRDMLCSDTLFTNAAHTPEQAVDFLFEKARRENPNAYSIHIGLPDTLDKASVINVTVAPEKGVYYNSDRYSFDRYSLKEIPSKSPYSGTYADASWADKLRRMNYEIHIGSIWGTPGKILMFFAALFGASLPLTGFYLFFKKRHKHRKKA